MASLESLFNTDQQTAINATIADLTSAPYQDVNVGFILASAYLVFFMHCGFAMISIGSVRSRFAKHISILILLDACASAFGFYITGYAFAFGDNVNEDGSNNGNPFIGTRFFALNNLDANQYHLWFFQWTFAATACTIVSGAIAERARFEAYSLYSLFMASWVYPIIVHSIWSNAGWASMFRSTVGNNSLLLTSGAIDFAGSGAVHMVGGYAAAAGCWILGPRIGRFTGDTVVNMPGHNSSLFVLGVLILWFGWYGFNPGSQLALIKGSAAVANAAVTTTLAPAAAGMAALFFQALWVYFTEGHRLVYDIMCMGNGALAGLVAITSGTSTVYPWAAIIIGIVAGFLYVLGSRVSVWLRLDDPLDAIAVHAWNGTWGVIAVGLFAGEKLVFNSYGPNPRGGPEGSPDYYRHYGAFMGGHGYLLGAQIIYALWIAGWVLGMMIPFFWGLKVLGLFRVPVDEEVIGLDASYHGGPAYDHYDAEGERSMHAARLAADAMNGNGAANGTAAGSDRSMMVELTNLRNKVNRMEKALGGTDRSAHLAPHVKGLEDHPRATMGPHSKNLEDTRGAGVPNVKGVEDPPATN